MKGTGVGLLLMTLNQMLSEWGGLGLAAMGLKVLMSLTPNYSLLTLQYQSTDEEPPCSTSHNKAVSVWANSMGISPT